MSAQFTHAMLATRDALKQPSNIPELDESDLSGIINKHVVYTYDNGWLYESWFKSPTRIVYRIHGGPMGGRDNLQTYTTRRVRSDVYMISWMEETGTTVTMVVDFARLRLHSNIIFSKALSLRAPSCACVEKITLDCVRISKFDADVMVPVPGGVRRCD
ncbi:hypothetical protein M427DRAFT_131457 [Gonapodya prolifera JEL478]|uniref:Phenolic acid decarboxylase n=1 Tax=Gonapodya prolifera (strain JEL478) TaxID=1344416 RepID=A0A139AU44_GONPJ|nr:hypothetical protein M427DRAFT_131457 [Gonapodya prolifera JEL478]|eukprot:KXS20015.1 hypothetical protein M427DRAFT_131457 [Gonapodya prolifera JEL478]